LNSSIASAISLRNLEPLKPVIGVPEIFIDASDKSRAGF
jgi:hypothetical protein